MNNSTLTLTKVNLELIIIIYFVSPGINNFNYRVITQGVLAGEICLCYTK